MAMHWQNNHIRQTDHAESDAASKRMQTKQTYEPLRLEPMTSFSVIGRRDDAVSCVADNDLQKF